MPPDGPSRPVFVGGVGRSGTHVMAHLAAASAGLAMVPREAVFHATPKGLPGVLDGTVSVETFVRRLRNLWWRRATPWDPTVERGLFKTVPEPRFEAAVAAFEADAAGGEVIAAARSLVRSVFDPLATDAGARDWVEMTPANAAAADGLHTLFPALRMIHVVRDARDVACSLMRVPWGPTTHAGALSYWEANLRRAAAGTARLPRGCVLVVQLEELLLTDRERSFDRVRRFLGLEDEPGMRRFFDENVTAGRGHVGRWRAELSRAERARITGAYYEVLEGLASDGIGCAPPLEPLPTRFSGTPWRPATTAIDPWADGRAVDA